MDALGILLHFIELIKIPTFVTELSADSFAADAVVRETGVWFRGTAAPLLTLVVFGTCWIVFVST